ncbi:MAG: iron uptake protein [Oxalobacteraceae bacterium]|nr:iron uptake protein [Oxalobacteraceae bacterium]
MKVLDRKLPLDRFDCFLRLLGAVFGGYALTALTVAAAGAVMARFGMARSEAVVLAAMLGFVAYLALLLWAFSVRSVARLWVALAAGGAAMAILLHFVS